MGLRQQHELSLYNPSRNTTHLEEFSLATMSGCMVKVRDCERRSIELVDSLGTMRHESNDHIRRRTHLGIPRRRRLFVPS